MIFSEKLFVLRKSKGLTQEDLAEHLNVSRQAIAKWESGQAYPDISNIIAISEFFRVTIDHLVKDNNNCTTALVTQVPYEKEEVVKFMIQAKKETYASKAALLLVPEDKPFRGPAFYQENDYIYRCKLTGDMDWFQGHEEISYKNQPVYECYFHGGAIK